jgi:hypothetical protein
VDSFAETIAQIGRRLPRVESPVLRVRGPIRPDFGADTSAFGAGHARAERSDRGVVGQVVDVQRDAVVADHVAATVALFGWLGKEHRPVVLSEQSIGDM